MNLIPQLAEPMKLEDLPKYSVDDEWAFNQKLDGKRGLTVVESGRVRGVGRNGQSISLPFAHELAFPGDWVFDGEVMHDGVYWIFDLVVAPMEIGPATPYRLRSQVLEGLKGVLESDLVKILPVARTTQEKVDLAKRVITSGAEGLILRHVEAGYASGQRLPVMKKAKLVKDLDAFITRFGIGVSSNGSGEPKQNCGLGVYDEQGKVREIATCIIHPKERNQVRAYDDLRPEVAHLTPICRVHYLYAIDPNKPRLVQPTRLEPRFHEKAIQECTIDQILFTDRSVLV